MRDTIKRSIELPTDMYSKLEKIAAEFDIPIAAIIKIACIEYIKRHDQVIEQ